MKHSKIAAFFLIISLLIMSVSSCTAPDTEGEYFEFCDSSGNTVALDTRPSRVAVLFSSFADMWQLAGGEVYVTVGESVERGICEESVLLVDAGAGKTVNTELLISYAPDLVICSRDIPAQSSAAELTRSLGIPTAEFHVESFSDYLHVLDIMTDITGNKDAYRTYGTELFEKITALKCGLPEAEKRILFIRASQSAKSTKAKGKDDHFAAAMLEELGAHNIADDAPILLDGLSAEAILAEDPDIIFISTMGDEAGAKRYMDSLLSGSVYRELDAVKCGRCYYLPKDLFQFKPNASWYEAYLLLSELLYD